LAARAGEAGLPVVIHTGLQAGNYNRVTNANPLLLQNLIAANPKTRFDLFHGGMPWVREIAVLAKYFPHVYLNMAWMHIISPSQARSALAEWLDMVPNSKIFGFGGDYSIVEKVYGHLKIARENIALVLAAKVREGAWSRADASLVARRLMRDNPAEFYRLNLR
jgi:predicted TIM-barrel fold metal-dependent hydrolase